MKYIDLKAQYDYLKDEIDKNIASVLNATQFIGGSFVDNLETELAAYVGRKYCITCASGTDALMLSFMAYGFKEGDAIFCPDMTFCASIEPACLLGATPVFCDIDPVSYNIHPEYLEQAIISTLEGEKYTPKAVVAVDFLGNPFNYDEIYKVCKKYNIIIIEDAAQAMGARYKNRMCGSLGDISCTSFFPSKPLGCYGDGGAIFTDSEEIANLIESLKCHGKGATKYDNVRIGMNSRLDNLQAAILLPKLHVLDREIVLRQKVAKLYNEALNKEYIIPYIEHDCISAYAQYCLLAKDSTQRKRLIQKLNQYNIPSLIYYPYPLHSLKAFHKYNGLIYKNSVDYATRNFGIPFSPYITREEQTSVISLLLSECYNNESN